MPDDLPLLLQPDYLPFRLDVAEGRLLLLRLSTQQRTDAAFLDERVCAGRPAGAWVPWQAAEEASLRCADLPVNWIFHIGHCGSTLLSRLLESPVQHVLREPLALRDLASAAVVGACPEDRLGPYLQALSRLWARPVAAHGSTLVKATSSCNALVGPLLATRSDDRIVLLDMPLRPYLATLLKSPASVKDALAAADERWQLLRRAWPDAQLRPPQSAGEACAMGWLAEQVRFEDIARHDGRALRVDFERMLEQPRDTLERIVVHLRLAHETTDSAMSSSWWNRYAKAGEHAYGIEDRLHDQRLSMSRFTGEIESGIGWVRAASASRAA